MLYFKLLIPCRFWKINLSIHKRSESTTQKTETDVSWTEFIRQIHKVTHHQD